MPAVMRTTHPDLDFVIAFGHSPWHTWFNGVILTLWLASFIAFVRVAQLVLDKPEFNWLLHTFMLYVDACIIYLVLPPPGQKLSVGDEEKGLFEKVGCSGLKDAGKQKANHVVAEKDHLLEKVEYMVLKVEDEENGSL
ncbi:hypothetical protein ACHAPJ_003639 [Fusarium lateritium]